MKLSHLLSMLILSLGLAIPAAQAEVPPAGGEDRTVYTIYKKDNSWLDGTVLKIDYIFGEKYYLLTPEGATRPIRVKADEVFQVTDRENEDASERIRYHMGLGIEAEGKGFWDVAVKEFDKVLSIDPGNIEARNRLVQVVEKSGVPLEKNPLRRDPNANAAKKADPSQMSPDEFGKAFGLRDDQVAFLRMVSDAHSIDFKRLVSQAVGNWIKDYKDYKISQAPEELPKLRHSLIPEE